MSTHSIMLVESVALTFFGETINCSIKLSKYAAPPHRAAITIEDAYDGSLVTRATTNASDFLTGMPDHYTIFKTYAENEGLLEQLLPLRGEDGKALFEMTGVKVMLSPHATCPVISLVNSARAALSQINP